MKFAHSIIVSLAIAASSAGAQVPNISLAGIHIGQSKTEVSAVTGTDSGFVRAFSLGGATGSLALQYKDGALDMAMFVFSPVQFEKIREAFSEKYSGLKCVESEVQNAMGAKFLQIDCAHRDSQAILQISKYMDLSRSMVKIQSVQREQTQKQREMEDKKKI